MISPPEQFRNDPALFCLSLVYQSSEGPRVFGEVAADFQREWIDSIAPSLLAIVNGTKPPRGKFWFEGTKGIAKDGLLTMFVLYLLIYSPRNLLIQIAAADQQQAAEMRLVALSLVKLNPWLTMHVEVLKDRVVNASTDSEARTLTTDDLGSHGARPDALIINEISNISNEGYVHTLLDNATKVPHCLVCCASNAGFVDSWQHRLRELFRSMPERWTFFKWDKPAPWIPAGEIEEARLRNSEERFDRLYRGIWGHGGGNGFKYEEIKRSIILPGPHTEPIGPLYYYGSVDLAVRKDSAAFVLSAINPFSNRIEIARVESWSPQQFGGTIDLELVERTILETCKKFNVNWVLFDPHQGELMMQRLGNAGVNCIHWISHAKWQHAMAVSMIEALQAGTLAMYPHELLIADLSKAKIVDRPAGYRIEWPKDEFGHCDRGQCVAQAMPRLKEELDATVELELQKQYGGHVQEIVHA